MLKKMNWAEEICARPVLNDIDFGRRREIFGIA
jgi:hypothetical protein